MGQWQCALSGNLHADSLVIASENLTHKPTLFCFVYDYRLRRPFQRLFNGPNPDPLTLRFANGFQFYCEALLNHTDLLEEQLSNCSGQNIYNYLKHV